MTSVAKTNTVDEDLIQSDKEIKKLVSFARKYQTLIKNEVLQYKKPYGSINISREDFIRRLESSNKHLFVKILNEKAGFVAARQKLISAKLITGDLTKLNSPCIEDYLDEIGLEYILATLIDALMNVRNIREKIVISSKDIELFKTAMRKLKGIINKSEKFYSEIESKQHLLNWLLNDLLKNTNVSPLNARRDNPFFLKRLMMKRLMQGIFRRFQRKEITRNLVVELALDIASVFFIKPMDKSDLAELADEIIANVIKENEFLNLRILAILDVFFKEQP